jgi:hypothetical protein
MRIKENFNSNDSIKSFFASFSALKHDKQYEIQKPLSIKTRRTEKLNLKIGFKLQTLFQTIDK